MKPRVVQVLNTEYKVVACWGSDKVLRQTLKDYHHNQSEENLERCEYSHGMCYWTEGCHPVIWLPRKPKTPSEIGTLAHEATHAVEFIFRFISEEHRGEVYAHSIGAVVREVMK